MTTQTATNASVNSATDRRRSNSTSTTPVDGGHLIVREVPLADENWAEVVEYPLPRNQNSHKGQIRFQNGGET
ncbi:MAG: hypothetical protein WC073_15815 [Sterolibacterium sp.]